LSNDLALHQYEQALAALDKESASPTEKVEMLMEMAMGLQTRPKTAQQVIDAVSLYQRAIELCPEEEILLQARLRARRSTALQLIPSEEPGFLLQAKDELETALTIFTQHTASVAAEEIAEAQMNLGLVQQSLVPLYRAKITDAIECYQRALRVFNRTDFPTEYAILHNNLATAFLSMPMTDERGKMREALAVQSFEAALQVITLEDNPNEYAMLQNNLGNALQYVSSSHAVENNLRALDAYEEALKVRTLRNAPLPYATTLANKANCLRNLPDDLERVDEENEDKSTKISNINTNRMKESLILYKEAREIFAEYGELAKVGMLDQVIEELVAAIKSHDERVADGFGQSRF